MQLVSGRARRTVQKTPRTATERLRVDFDGQPENELQPGEIVLDEFTFSDCPVDQPIVVYSRTLEVEQARVLSANLVARQDPPPPVAIPLPRVDATAHEVLDDDEFWPVVDLLEGKAWETRIARASRALAKHPRDFILRFAQTMAWKAHLLDHPDLYPKDTSPENALAVEQGDYRWRFGAIIAGGKARYESVLASPATYDHKWMSDLSLSVLYLASAALERQDRVGALIDTTWDFTVGANTENWAGSGVEVRPYVPVAPTVEEEQEVQEKLAAINTDFIESTGIDPEFSPFAPNYKQWFAVRCFVDMKDHAVEMVALHGAAAFGAASVDQQVAAELARRVGGILIGVASGYSTQRMRLSSCGLFSHKRDSSLSLDEYVATFMDGR
jgi:hypothetical protein